MSERLISQPIAGVPGGGVMIVDGDQKTFMQDVVQASYQTPVLVDFWATWCGPCKQLTPTLEKVVRAAAGRVKLVKIDIDKNRALVQQLDQLGLPLQSVPTVVAFWQGQVVDLFQGAVPESEVRHFVEAVLTVAGGAMPAEWQEYALALRSYVDEVQRIIEDQQGLYSYVGMVQRIIDGEQSVFGLSLDDQLDMTDLSVRPETFRVI